MLPRLVYVTQVLTPAGYDHVHDLLCDMADTLVDDHFGLCELLDDELFCDVEE